MFLETTLVCNYTFPNSFIYFYTYIKHYHPSKSQKYPFLMILGYSKLVFRSPKFSKCIRTFSWCNFTLTKDFHAVLYLYTSLSLFKVSKIAIFDDFGPFYACFQVSKIFQMFLDTTLVCNYTFPNISVYFHTYIKHYHPSKSQNNHF